MLLVWVTVSGSWWFNISNNSLNIIILVASYVTSNVVDRPSYLGVWCSVSRLKTWGNWVWPVSKMCIISASSGCVLVYPLNMTSQMQCFYDAVDWIEQCFTSPPTQYRLYGRRFLQVKRLNQQYQSTEGRCYKSKEKPENSNNTKYSNTIIRHTYNSLVYNNTMGD